jgi:hypothetical protein
MCPDRTVKRRALGARRAAGASPLPGDSQPSRGRYNSVAFPEPRVSLRKVTLYAAWLGAMLGAVPAAAQTRLIDAGSATVTPVFESWTFASGGLPEPTFDASSTVRVSGASEWSIPVTATVPIGSAWRIDAAAAYSDAHVSLVGRDTALNTSHYDLTGLSDVRIRATGHLVGDNVVVTFGVNAPSGATSLTPGQLNALRVVAAPALAFPTPAFGLGPSGTAGVVLAREIAGWAWGVGGTYELRTSYTPVGDVEGLGVPNFSPSNIVHLSAGTEGLIGQSAMAISAGVDFFGLNHLTTPATTFAGQPVPGLAVGTQLGPIFTFSWQLQLAARAFRDLTLYAVERYRTDYKSESVDIAGSSGHYVDAGVSGAIPTSPATDVESAVYVRYQTGLTSTPEIATAGTRAAGIRLGLGQRLGAHLRIGPFLRGEIGNLSTGGVTASAHSLTAGLALTDRF